MSRVTVCSDRGLLKLVTREKPPHGRRDALKRWQVARSRFKEAIDIARTTAGALEALRNDCLQRDALNAALIEKHAQATELLEQTERGHAALESARRAHAQAAEAFARAEQHLQEHRWQRPPWWQRWLRFETAR